jgi:CRP/FNR family cyclic AMP-dependent transcriptional regulator
VRLRKDAKLEVLRRVPLFAGCSKKELAEIATLTDELSLPAGTSLIREGQLGHEFFALVEGEVDVRAKGKEVKHLEGGEFFGDMALVSSRPMNAYVSLFFWLGLMFVLE